MTVTQIAVLPVTIQDGVTLLDASSVMPNFTELRDKHNTHTHDEFLNALVLSPTTDARNQIAGDTPARLVLPLKVAGDTQNRLQINANGTLSWGPGGSTTPDTTLYRSAASRLHTDGVFEVGSALIIDAQGGGSANKLYFGSALDTNLYRLAATILKTDGYLEIGQDLMMPSATGKLRIANIVSGAVGGAQSNKLPIYNYSGVLIGYVPLYAT